jgi:DNA-binding NarL/FixJ family response regulator
MKILIVDDNIEMRRLIKTLVGKIADAVYECDDGRNALREYARHRPDFVLMDIEMGETDGILATTEIINSYPLARIIIVTNHQDDNYRQAARAAGACGYVVKHNLFDLKPLLASLDSKARGQT